MVRAPSAVEPLLCEKTSAGRVYRVKPRVWCGYKPLWSEIVPQDRETEKTDWEALIVNVGAGFIMGVREALGGIVSASLIFSSSHREVSDMLPWGISSTLYTMSVGVIWYAIFGRLQYAYATQQDLTCILQAEMASHIAEYLKHTPDKIDKIPATVVAVICLSSVMSGVCSLFMGKLGLGNYMLLFPTPVTNGFLGAIGVVVVRAALQTASGVKFHFCYPTDWDAFVATNSLAQLLCMLLHVLCIRQGPELLKKMFHDSAGKKNEKRPNTSTVERVGGLVCQLMPLVLFYVACFILGVNFTMLSNAGWTYPPQGASGPLHMWTRYSVRDVDIPTLVAVSSEIPSVVLLAVLCTMLGALAITDAFPTGPEGDPAPLDPIDFDTELTVVGASSVLLGCTGGNLNFHKFSAIQMRLDGGTHRIGVLVIGSLSGVLWLSGLPLGQLVPKWFLAGLFLNTGYHFLKKTLLSYQLMSTFTVRGRSVPSPQYMLAPFAIVMAVFTSPTDAILVSLVLSILIFLYNSANSSPVINVVSGDRVVSRSKRPFWELHVLKQEGSRIVLLYLQGQLFFGSVRNLVAALGATSANGDVQYCILSFARVPGVDASAARHLKTAAEKLRLRGCRVIYCRMNQAVYSALSAVQAIVAPDEDLLSHLQNRRWKQVPMTPKPHKRKPSAPASPRHGREPVVAPVQSPYLRPQSPPHSPPPPSDESDSPTNQLLTAASRLSEVKKNQNQPDAFAHETDALDYCDEQIVDEFCYGSKSDQELEHYMKVYRAAVCTSGNRLPEWAFEDMNGLPRGLMTQLKPFCHVHTNVQAWTKMSDKPGVEGSLCFILKGSISVIQMLPISNDVTFIQPEVHGFSFREGKRLLKRYPPGHVAGKNAFFRKYSADVEDQEDQPKLIVSSKMGPPAEIWVLQPESWERMPVDLKGPLTKMLCVQFTDDEEHTRLQEH